LLLPNVPTMSEAGYPEINVVPWYGYAAPRGTPPRVVDKIVAGFNEALRVPKVRELLEKQALQGRADERERACHALCRGHGEIRQGHSRGRDQAVIVFAQESRIALKN
jgi:hypothetical protein